MATIFDLNYFIGITIINTLLIGIKNYKYGHLKKLYCKYNFFNLLNT